MNGRIFYLNKPVIGFLTPLLCLGASVLGVPAQGDVIRIDTKLVTVPAAVMDRDGRYLADLKRDNFQIREDGIAQEIVLFEPIETPFTVLLLLDSSGSMNANIPDIAKAANAFISQLREDDQLIIATFADDKKIRIVCPPVKKRDFHQSIVLWPRMGDSYTTTFNAVKRGMEYIGRFEGRRAIVLFSDGELYGRGMSAQDNLRDAEEQEAAIYTVRFGSYPNSQPGYGRVSGKKLEELIRKVNGYMRGLSERTGGRSYEVPKVEDLRAAFRSVANDLGRQYRLGYYSTSPGKAGEHRKIDVHVNIPNAAVRSRSEVVF